MKELLSLRHNDDNAVVLKISSFRDIADILTDRIIGQVVFTSK